MNTEPENPNAYIYKLLIEFSCHTVDELADLTTSIASSKNYAKVLRFGTEEHKSIIEQAETTIQEKIRAEKERLDAEKRQKELDLDSEEYLDVICPKCGQELSYMPWQADEEGNVECPDCCSKFKLNL